MNLIIVLVLSLISILFLLIGTLIVFSTKNNKKVMVFSVSLGFVVLLLLGIMHLIPDAYEYLREALSVKKSAIFLLVFGLLGFLVISLIDLFGGHHHNHEGHEKGHFKHISIITCIFLVVHNLIEGMTIYSSVLLSYETAIMLTLGIGLHNIPLGFTLSSTFNKTHGKLETLLYIVFIGFSYLIGALVAYKFNEVFMNSVVLGAALIFTFGMILYIAIYEFLPLIKESKEEKMRNLGMLVGIILMAATLFL